MKKIERGHLIIQDGSRKYVVKPFSFFGKGFFTVPFNEVIAFDLSNRLGMELVPETFVADVLIKSNTSEMSVEGSFQKFIEAVPICYYNGRINILSGTELFLFDVLTGNIDRSIENTLVDKTGKIWGVDNGFSLLFNSNREYDLRAENGGVLNKEVNPMDLANCDLGINDKLKRCIDKDYLQKLIDKIQQTRFEFKFQILNDEEEKELKGILNHRIKYLPLLTWKNSFIKS